MDSLLLNVEDLMLLYGYGPKEGVDPKVMKQRFLNFKSHNPHLFPKPLTRGYWHRDSIKDHLDKLYAESLLKPTNSEPEIEKPTRRRRRSSSSKMLSLI